MFHFLQEEASSMKTDIQIAQEAELFPVTQVAESAGIPADSL